MAREPDWEVFHHDGKPGYLVRARSAAGAVDVVMRERRMPEAQRSELLPHRADCDCDDITQVCVLAQLEERLRDTPLGKLARLA